jgi:hypothetical protein
MGWLIFGCCGLLRRETTVQFYFWQLKKIATMKGTILKETLTNDIMYNNYLLEIINISKINNMRWAIKSCKQNIIVTDALAIRLTFQS